MGKYGQSQDLLGGAVKGNEGPLVNSLLLLNHTHAGLAVLSLQNTLYFFSQMEAN